ncbi:MULTISPECIES: hypothetical protein [unclassified Nostoc]|nr:hypothetical protein [Nostoc sp. DedQUE03]MDZ7976450.1 hypothetical protein [Nostoc sp. DedQUE03]MDZ8042773.1 hypothetical protein [Nostoc sp. DedQUE02]
MANLRVQDNGWSQLTRGAPLAVILAAVKYQSKLCCKLTGILNC